MDGNLQIFVDRLRRSRIYQLVNADKKQTMMDALLNADSRKLPFLMAKLDEEDKKISVMEKEIKEKEAKQHALNEKKKNYLKDLAEKIAQEKIESEKIAESILASLDNAGNQTKNKPMHFWSFLRKKED